MLRTTTTILVVIAILALVSLISSLHTRSPSSPRNAHVEHGTDAFSTRSTSHITAPIIHTSTTSALSAELQPPARSEAATGSQATYRNEKYGFEFQYPTVPDKFGGVPTPTTNVDPREPWLFSLMFCSLYEDGNKSCGGMGDGDNPDFGIRPSDSAGIPSFSQLGTSWPLGFNLDLTPQEVSPVIVSHRQGYILRFNYTYGAQSGKFRELQVSRENELIVFGLVDDHAQRSAIFDTVLATLSFF